MKFITTPTEVTSCFKLIAAIMKSIPGNLVPDDTMAKLREIQNEYRFVLEDDSVEARNDFNHKHGDDDGIVSSYIDEDNCLVMDFNEDALSETLDALTEEVSTWSGMLVSLYGIAMMFKASFKRLGQRMAEINSKYMDRTESTEQSQ